MESTKSSPRPHGSPCTFFEYGILSQNCFLLNPRPADVPDVAVDAGGEGPGGRRHRRQAGRQALPLPQAEAGVTVQERANQVRGVSVSTG